MLKRRERRAPPPTTCGCTALTGQFDQGLDGVVAGFIMVLKIHKSDLSILSKFTNYFDVESLSFFDPLLCRVESAQSIFAT